MSSPTTGPEDSPQWVKFMGKDLSHSLDTCAKCKEPIEYWHCAELKCPWCEECGKGAYVQKQVDDA